MKILDSSSLQDTMEERAKHYKNLREQFTQLKTTFSEIVDLEDFEGKGADAIKSFYQGQMEVVEAWQRLVDRQIAFFKGVSGKLQDKDLVGNTRVETAFLEDDLARKERLADNIVTEQKKALDDIFQEIDDLVSLNSFSRSQFDDLMMDVNKKRTDTLKVINEVDQDLKAEYNSSEGEEGYVIQLFSALLEATKQGNSITPINFNSEAFHASEAYQVKAEAEEITAVYLTYKKEEKEAREIENRPWYEDLWEGTKTFAGEFSGYYDYLRATEGVDPVTGEKLSTTQRVTVGAMALAGFIPVVGWAGRAVKGGKGIYSATRGISAAEHAMSAYKNVHTFSALEKTEMGIYGLISANGLSEYLTGKDMLGNELTAEQRHASLAQSIFAGLPFVPAMAKEAKTLSQETANATVRLSQQSIEASKNFANDVSRMMNGSPHYQTAEGIELVDDSFQVNKKVDTAPVSKEKEELLSMLSGRAGGEGRGLYRGDDLLYSPKRPNGIGKPYVSEEGNLVPASKEGIYKGRQVTVTEHILGGFRKGAKSNSPYTSFTDSKEVIVNYGENSIKIDISALRQAIQSGELTDVVILSPKQIQRLIREDTTTTDHWKKMALKWTTRDNEYLIRGEVPSQFITILKKEGTE